MTTAAPTLSPGNTPSGRYERLIIGGLLAVIASWGFVGVDWDSRVVAPEEPPAAGRAFTPLPPLSDGEVEMSVSARRGAAVFEANGCYACHSLDGSEKIGPSLLGIWNEQQQLSDGSLVVADRDYVHESILYPQAKLVAGFTDAAMPSYLDLINDNDLEALIDYLETLR